MDKCNATLQYEMLPNSGQCTAGGSAAFRKAVRVHSRRGKRTEGTTPCFLPEGVCFSIGSHSNSVNYLPFWWVKKWSNDSFI